jgi:hypothetical protein
VKSEAASFRRLVLPFGAVTGARIVLDGTAGVIDVFDAANNLVASIDATGIKALGTAASGSYVLMNNAGAQAQFTLNPATQGGHTQVPATLEAFFFTPGGLHPALEIDSPSIDGRPASTITLIGEDSLGGNLRSIDFTADALTKNNQPARVLTFSESYPLTLALTLTAVAQPVLFGASSPSGDVPNAVTGVITVTTSATNTRWEATLFTDAQIATANDTTIADLKIDGALTPGEALFSTSGTGRATVGQTWSGSFATAGAHTFQVTGKRAGAGAANVFNAVHTRIRIDIFE